MESETVNFQAWNTVILAITALVIWAYTFEAQKSNEIQERPLLDFYIKKTSTGANTDLLFYIRNISKRTAFNIEIESIRTHGNFIYTPNMEDEVNMRVSPLSEEEIRFWIKMPDNATQIYPTITGVQSLISRLFCIDANLANEQLRKIGGLFVVNFQAANGKFYHEVFRFYPPLTLIFDSDLIVQFVTGGSGKITKAEALAEAETMPLLKHAAERNTQDLV
ncbi:hypothetical protein COB87_002725 [Candidatus Wolfebacteria bacterium]|nr:hypothetical protein [Candidatus Wolfebacteria bacterium]